jgi:DNA primase
MEQVTRYRIGYCPDGPLARYLVFPIGHFQEDVYWTTRYCGDHDPKSKNPPNTEGYMRKQDVLFGFDNALGKEQVVVCEGPISAMAYPNGVALLGKTISPAQIALLDELVAEGSREIVISLDADARREATVVYQQLAGHAPKVTVVELDYGDPDDRKEDLHLFLEKRHKIRMTDSLTRLLPTLG